MTNQERIAAIRAAESDRTCANPRCAYQVQAAMDYQEEVGNR